jgi:hypothetical protein
MKAASKLVLVKLLTMAVDQVVLNVIRREGKPRVEVRNMVALKKPAP